MGQAFFPSDSMPRQECCAAFNPEVPPQRRPVGRQWVHQEQAIHRIGKLRIQVEAQEPGVQFQVILEQNRKALAIPLCIPGGPATSCSW